MSVSIVFGIIMTNDHHPQGTSGIRKYLSLLILFNARAAMMSTFLGSRYEAFSDRLASSSLTVSASRKMTRCVFELATFLRSRCSRPIQLLPVEMSMLSFLIGLCYSMVNLAYRTIDEARNFTVPGGLEATPWLATLKASGWLAVIGGPVVPFFIYLGLDFMMKLRLLPTQLHTFVDHSDPHTKTPIFCDRKLIMEKLTEWYGDPEDCEDMDVDADRAIEQFNHLVRKELSDVCLAMMSGRDVLWRYIYLLIGMSLVLQEPANVSVPSMNSAQSIACKRTEHHFLPARNCHVFTYLLGDIGFPPDSME
ncbi:hypothetical protein AK812_SmicGene26355, partial [Symbiodinium microadriaticum]